MNKFRCRIAKLDEKIKAAQDKKRDLQIEMMLSCSHPLEEIFEVRRETYYSYNSPYNLCRLCGYAEDDWRTPVHLGVAYSKNLPKLDEREAHKYLTRHYFVDDMDAMEYPEREEHKKKAADPWIKPFLKPAKWYVK